MKYKIIILVFLILSFLVCVVVKFNKYMEKNLYKDESEKIAITNNFIYLVRHRVPKNQNDIYRILGLDSLIFRFHDPYLEKFDLNSGKLLETKPGNMVYHTGYFRDGFIVDTKIEDKTIKIYSLNDMKLIHFNFNDGESIAYDYLTQLFYAKKKNKYFKLKGENDFEALDIPIKFNFFINYIDKSKFLLHVEKAKESKLNEYQIYDRFNNTIKGVELIPEDLEIFGMKNLKILVRKGGNYFIFELIENETSYLVKNNFILHKSSFILDNCDWDRNNNKIYFYDDADAMFTDHFDVYQYDDNTFEKKIISVNFKR